MVDNLAFSLAWWGGQALGPRGARSWQLAGYERGRAWSSAGGQRTKLAASRRTSNADTVVTTDGCPSLGHFRHRRRQKKLRSRPHLRAPCSHAPMLHRLSNLPVARLGATTVAVVIPSHHHPALLLRMTGAFAVRNAAQLLLRCLSPVGA